MTVQDLAFSLNGAHRTGPMRALAGFRPTSVHSPYGAGRYAPVNITIRHRAAPRTSFQGRALPPTRFAMGHAIQRLARESDRLEDLVRHLIPIDSLLRRLDLPEPLGGRQLPLAVERDEPRAPGSVLLQPGVRVVRRQSVLPYQCLGVVVDDVLDGVREVKGASIAVERGREA